MLFRSHRLEQLGEGDTLHGFVATTNTGADVPFYMLYTLGGSGGLKSFRPDLLGGVTVITGRALGLYPGDDGRSVVTREKDFVAVPYNVWSNRGEDRMAVWLPRRVRLDFEVPRSEDVV